MSRFLTEVYLRHADLFNHNYLNNCFNFSYLQFLDHAIPTTKSHACLTLRALLVLPRAWAWPTTTLSPICARLGLQGWTTSRWPVTNTKTSPSPCCPFSTSTPWQPSCRWDSTTASSSLPCPSSSQKHISKPVFSTRYVKLATLWLKNFRPSKLLVSFFL